MITAVSLTRRYSGFTAADTMGLPRKRVEELLELVSLTPTEARRRVRNYSLGMRQRLGMFLSLTADTQREGVAA